MRLLLSLLNYEELFTDKLNYKIYDERLKNLLPNFKQFIENQNIKEFKRLIRKCSQNSSLFEIIDFFPETIILYINMINEWLEIKIISQLKLIEIVFLLSQIKKMNMEEFKLIYA